MKALRLILIGVLVLGACLVVSACADSGLSEHLATAVDEGPGTQFMMSDLTDFAWQKLYVFPPYTTQKQIDRSLGFEWPDPAGIILKDTITLLAFVDNGEVVRYVAQPRDQGDFARLSEGSPWTPKTALFRVLAGGVVGQGYEAP